MAFAIGIRYLTGYAVATDVSNREVAEWPPHPARVFMAMVAAYFETGGDDAERAALEWMESQGPPKAMYVPEKHARTVVKHYVAVNDKPGPAKAELQSCPGLTRSKQPRFFPRVRLDEECVYLLWSGVTPDERCRSALSRICDKVTRVGHSASLVQMWIAEVDSIPKANLITSLDGSEHLRIATAGTLAYLESSYNLTVIEQHTALQLEIELTSARSKAITGKGSTERRIEIKQQIEELKEKQGRLDPHPPIRPTIGLWQAYRRVTEMPESESLITGAFDRDILVLSHDEQRVQQRVLGMETTWHLLTTLHKTILSKCEPDPPEWVSGHQADGLPSKQPHLALLPLAFVGHKHADGHVMGIGLAFPRGVALYERGRVLRPLLYDEHGQPRAIRLKLGSLGEWTLRRETRNFSVTPTALQAETWTAASDIWATVTPIVLDRHPKSNRSKDKVQWSAEVAETIAESCLRQGLPAPIEIDISTTCWHIGSPRAVPGTGGGFPLMPVKDGRHPRQQLHALLRFAKPIVGPLILGAGRYRGYGLCKPLAKSVQ